MTSLEVTQMRLRQDAAVNAAIVKLIMEIPTGVVFPITPEITEIFRELYAKGHVQGVRDFGAALATSVAEESGA
jgi:hypothetical protein